MRYLFILLLFASCVKPCREMTVKVGEGRTEYQCHTAITEYFNRVEVCGYDTTIISCYVSKRYEYKPCYQHNAR